jgi:flagellin-like protein
MNKKGLSGVITTLIIICIAIVLVGVAWFTINFIIHSSAEKVRKASECNIYSHGIIDVCITISNELRISIRNSLSEDLKVNIIGKFTTGDFNWILGDNRCGDVRLKDQPYGVYIPLLETNKTETYFINITGLGSLSELKLIHEICNPIEYKKISVCENDD